MGLDEVANEVRAHSLATYMVWRFEEELQEEDPEFILDGDIFHSFRDSIKLLIQNLHKENKQSS